jgi:hypothetical protein
MVNVRIKRNAADDKQTLGDLTVSRNGEIAFQCVTLELPWKQNRRSVSCIPPGVYKASRRFTDERGWHFIVDDVPGRSYILFHPGVNFRHTQGCILIGKRYGDLNKDGYLDLIESKNTFAKMLALIPEKDFSLIIE